MIVFGTGHRPEDAGYSREFMVERAQQELDSRHEKVTVAVCGMAGGFDLAFALAAIDLDINVWTVRPWAGHKARLADRHVYHEIMAAAERIITVHQVEAYPGPWVYQDRNEWMVDISESGLSFWSGKEAGGTWNCIKYAGLCQKPVYNIFPGKEGLI